MPRAVQHPRAAVGMDGANFRSWRSAIADALRWPWFDRTIDGTPAAPVPQPEPFESLKSFAASGAKGCVSARKRLRAATNRGLAAALGRELPKVLAQ